MACPCDRTKVRPGDGGGRAIGVGTHRVAPMDHGSGTRENCSLNKHCALARPVVDLVHLVGCLEYVTDRLVIDLVTVAQYQVGKTKLVVPSRTAAQPASPSKRGRSTLSDEVIGSEGTMKTWFGNIDAGR